MPIRSAEAPSTTGQEPSRISVPARDYQLTEVEYRAREEASEGISIDRLLASAL